MRRPHLDRWLWIGFLILGALLLILFGRILKGLQDLPGAESEALRSELLFGALGVLILAGWGVYLLTRGLQHHLRSFQSSLRKLGVDSTERQLPLPDSQEFAELGRTIWELLDAYQQRLGQLSRENEEQALLLASMQEGYVAVDRDYRILRTNSVAADTLKFSLQECLGRDFRELIRNVDLHRGLEQLLCGETMEDQDLRVFVDGEEMSLRLSGTPLRLPGDEITGALIFFTDITRLQRLETMRRDFVANVSHELKTPITSVKGAVETLLGGAMEDPEMGRKFLQIAERNADRLNAIIDDLLILSRIEDGKSHALEMSWVRLEEVLQQVRQVCEPKAAGKSISMLIECPEGLQVQINPPLLEQALVNLVDNAIKYSEPQTQVRLKASQEQSLLTIEVQDEGFGVEVKHVDRLFERFYRVDKARSRKVGGTGLGLAIVKHIVHAHGGAIQVRSALGQGSTFCLELPQPQLASATPEPSPNVIETAS
jgi:two-component system phosphate regulon sensor histidine kinase PhoR